MNPATLSALILGAWPLVHNDSYSDAKAEINGFIKSLLSDVPDKGGIVKIGERYIVGSDRASMAKALSIYEGSGATSAFKVIGSSLITTGWIPAKLKADYMTAVSDHLVVSVNSSESGSETRSSSFWSDAYKNKGETGVASIGSVHTYYRSKLSRSEVGCDFVAQATNHGVIRLDKFVTSKVYANITLSKDEVLIVKGPCAVFNKEYMLAKPLWARLKENSSLDVNVERGKVLLPISPNFLFDNVQIFSAEQGSAYDGGLVRGSFHDSGGYNFSVVGLADNVLLFTARSEVSNEGVI